MRLPLACWTANTSQNLHHRWMSNPLSNHSRSICPIHFQTQCYAARIQNTCPRDALPMGQEQTPPVFATWAAPPGLTHIASQPRPLTRCLTITATPSPVMHNHHRQQRCPSACLLCASSQIHWRGHAAQQMLGNLPDCLLNTCCSRRQHQMPHAAAAPLLPMQGQNRKPTISTSAFPINTSAGEGMPNEHTQLAANSMQLRSQDE